MRTKFLLFLLSPFFIFANEISPNFKIKEVTVFLKGAQISGVSEVSLPQGVSLVKISGLSPEIDPNSIQISGLNDVTINSIKFEINYLEKKINQAEYDKIEKIYLERNRALAMFRNKVTALREEESLLKENKKVNNEHENVTIEQLNAYAEYYRRRIAEIQNEIYDLNQEINELSQEVNDITQEFNKLKNERNERRGEIFLTLDAERNSNLNLEISYNVRNAGWYPTYDIKTDNTNQPLSFHYKANVFQNTGNDWENVSVTLSTGNPNLNSQKPDLTPLYLNFIQYYSYGYMNGSVEQALQGKVAGVRLEADDAGEMREEAVVRQPEVTKADNMTHKLFNITKKYSIYSSKENTSITIDEFNIAADYEYFSAPVLQQKVYLTAKLEEWENFDLLPGEAKIYFNGNYAGKTFIDPFSVEEDFVVSLGEDPSLVVEREEVNDLKDKSFFGNTRIVNKTYKLTLKNNKNIPVEVTMVDRVPISQNKEIEVDDVEVGNADYKKDTGILTWKVNLSANGKQERQFSYVVKFPKDKKINLN
ncbi:DUF4139 domain-containing protein [Mesonia sp. K7]|uniref:DUF4139 domain-containing protein n=1 Tax=Mesonia sp. K7 TaxID=2218606 RepID=UPI000DA8D129|nr:DUF4139 domain-containing protein [Mesonia sp. K7]PZD78726.1 hypothetical protein DNG35_04550 [Mesonia sp. K7]